MEWRKQTNVMLGFESAKMIHTSSIVFCSPLRATSEFAIRILTAPHYIKSSLTHESNKTGIKHIRIRCEKNRETNSC